MTHPHFASCLLASQLLLTLATAQGTPLGGLQAPVAAWTAARQPIHPLQHDDQPVQLWARGSSYKASFHDGMTFIPFLGADYPHNQPFGWRTTSVRCGEHELLAAGETPRLQYEGFRAEYHFGALVEAYDVLENGLEQTFVIPKAPRAAGDLVIRGAVQSLLRTHTEGAAQQDLTFVDAAGTPILTYGRALAIDARGDHFAVTSRPIAGGIELRLAAADLDRVQFPLVVDPLLTRVSAGTTTTNYTSISSDIAIAEGTHTHSVLSAVTYAISGSDHDVQAISTDSGFTGGMYVFGDYSTEDSVGAKAAYVAGTDRWVLVWDATDTLGTRRIRTHVRYVNDLSTGSVTRSILNASGVHDWRPDVGGTLSGSSPHALVVFQRENSGGVFADTNLSTVMYTLLDTSTTYGTFVGVVQLSTIGNYDTERPSVSQQAAGGAAFSWVCVTQQLNNTIVGDDWDLVGRRIGQNGVVASGSWFSDVGTQTRHQLAPVVEGHDGRYAVVFSTVETAVGRTSSNQGRDIRLECFDWSEGNVSPDLNGNRPAVVIHSNASQALYATGLGFDDHTRSHWVAGFRAVAPLTPTGYMARCGYTGNLLEGPVVAYNAAGLVLSEIPVAFDSSIGSFSTTYHIASTTLSTRFGQSFVHPTVTPASTAGTGCSTATIGWTGPASGAFAPRNQLIGNREVALAVTSQNATDLHFVLASLGTNDLPIADPLVPAGCRLLVAASGASYLGTLPLAIGAQPRWPLALPEALGSVTLRFQDWIYDTASNQIRSTSRLTVPLVR